jgi:hypothetical protein
MLQGGGENAKLRGNNAKSHFANYGTQTQIIFLWFVPTGFGRLLGLKPWSRSVPCIKSYL